MLRDINQYKVLLTCMRSCAPPSVVRSSALKCSGGNTVKKLRYRPSGLVRVEWEAANDPGYQGGVLYIPSISATRGYSRDWLP